MKTKSFFATNQKKPPKEIIEVLAKSKNCRIERIMSGGQPTPRGKWYDQEKNEFAMLVDGKAEILFRPNKLLKLNKGDFVVIRKRLRHRVEKASKDALWLTVFY